MIRPTERHPVFLDLTKIAMPLAARVSILHRLTGLLMIMLIPLALYFLETSLSSQQGYEDVLSWFDSVPGSAALFLFLWSFFHHLCAGVRHLLIDVDIGVARTSMQRGARWVMVAGFLLTVSVWLLLP